MTAKCEKTTQTEKPELNSLSDEQLEQVAGGGQAVNKSSPTLSHACANGKHIPNATIVL